MKDPIMDISMIKVDLFLIFFAGEWQLDAFWNVYVQ
jgi:hypothetical protein